MMKPALLLVPVFILLSACAHETVLTDRDTSQTALLELGENLPKETEQLLSEYIAQMEEKLPLIEALAILSARDQYVRQRLARTVDVSELSADEIAALETAQSNYMASVDEANTAELKRLLEDLSWRDVANAGGDLIVKAFFVVQHSPDLEYQASVLEELEPLVSEGLFNAQQYVYLYDRVQLRRNRKQRYGTQLNCVDGDLDVVDLETPESVDERRAEVGLQPLAEYIELAKQHSKSC